MGKNSISDDDAALFRRAVGTVTRLTDDRVRSRGTRPHPVPKQTLADEEQVLHDMLSDGPYEAEVEAGEELIFTRAGCSSQLLKKLRRGQYARGAELDLHGMTVAEAQTALGQFLKECKTFQVRCVRIVHGKGLGSRDGRPVIKAKLDRWLRLRDEVLAFSSARPVDGGTGALYVLLRN